MSNGGAQFKEWGPYWDNSNSTIYTQIYVYAYDAGGYTVAKDFWDNEDKSGGAIQSKQGGTDGTVAAYFDGDYNIRIKASDDTTIIASFPNVKITSDTATMWEGNIGTALPSAAVANAGQLFLKRDGSDNIVGLYANDGKSGSAAFQLLVALSSGVTEFDVLYTGSVPFYNVKHSDYGAVGDNSADDTPKIQLAIDAAIAAGGGIVFFPEGTYRMDSAVEIEGSNIILWGAGAGSILKTGTGNFTTDMIVIGDGSSSYENVIIENLSFETTETKTAGAAILFNKITRCTVRGCRIKDQFYGFSTATANDTVWIDNCAIIDPVAANGRGLFIQDSGTYRISGVSVEQSSTAHDHGILVTAVGWLWMTDCVFDGALDNIAISPGDGQTAQKIMIKGCRATGATNGGVKIAPTHANGTILNVKIVGGIIEDSGDNGISVGAAAGTIDGVFIDDVSVMKNEKNGILLWGGSVTINTDVHSCTCSGNSNGASGTYSGIKVEGGTSLFSLINNRSGQTSGEANDQDYGIEIQAAASDEYSVIGNTLVNNSNGGLLDGGTGEDKIISNNLTDDSIALTAASSMEAPAHSDVFTITGTTAIDNITGGWDRRIVTFVFVDAVDINDKSGGAGEINLAGSADWTTGAADDTIQLIYLNSASAWFETSRSDNT